MIYLDKETFDRVAGGAMAKGDDPWNALALHLGCSRMEAKNAGYIWMYSNTGKLGDVLRKPELPSVADYAALERQLSAHLASHKTDS